MSAVCEWRRVFVHGRAIVTALALGLPAAAGCKTSSWSAPSWPSFGGTKSSDASKLSSAPAFGGDVAKPSASAKPYPTTSTPQGYVLKDSAGAAAGQPAGSAAAPELPPVVYGSTPPPAAAAPSSVARATPATEGTASSGPAGRPMSSIAPQVGPYAASPGGLPQETAATSPATAGFGPGATAPGAGIPPAGPTERMADARAGSAWPTAPSDPARMAPTETALPPAASGAAVGAVADPRFGNDSRYGSSTGSRFGGGAQPFVGTVTPPATEPFAPVAAQPSSSPNALTAPPPPAAAPPSPFAAQSMAGPSSAPLPASGGFPASAGLPPSTGLPPSATLPGSSAGLVPPTSALPPAATLPATMPSTLPATLPPASAPATPPIGSPPLRRPNPGYRPGGTSSYRPGPDFTTGEGVRPVSFEAAAPSDP